MNFTDDADGDVLTSLHESGFDFSQPVPIEFNVNFDSWPPDPEAISKIRKFAGNIEIVDPEHEYSGYLVFEMYQALSYQFVVSTQKTVTGLVASYCGFCESWGVLN